MLRRAHPQRHARPPPSPVGCRWRRARPAAKDSSMVQRYPTALTRGRERDRGRRTSSQRCPPLPGGRVGGVDESYQRSLWRREWRRFGFQWCGRSRTVKSIVRRAPILVLIWWLLCDRQDVPRCPGQARLDGEIVLPAAAFDANLCFPEGHPESSDIRRRSRLSNGSHTQLRYSI